MIVHIMAHYTGDSNTCVFVKRKRWNKTGRGEWWGPLWGASPPQENISAFDIS